MEKSSVCPLKPPGSNSSKLKGMVKRTYSLTPYDTSPDAPQKAGGGEGRMQATGDVRFTGSPALGSRIQVRKSL